MSSELEAKPVLARDPSEDAMLQKALVALDAKLVLARDPSEDEMLQKTLVDAEARLAVADRSKVNEYVDLMQQVLTLRQSLNSTETRDQLMAQKMVLLESMLTPQAQV